jgi:hypothetical protein
MSIRNSDRCFTNCRVNKCPTPHDALKTETWWCIFLQKDQSFKNCKNTISSGKKNVNDHSILIQQHDTQRICFYVHDTVKYRPLARSIIHVDEKHIHSNSTHQGMVTETVSD